jgi:hypothetical protein
MTRKTTHTPLSHERTRRRQQSDLDRVDDEYVFVAAIDDPGRNHDGPLSHSPRVDPMDGDEGELLVHVTRRHGPGSDTDRSHRDLVTVSVPAPGIGSQPLVRDLQSVLETWYRRHCLPGSPEQAGTSEPLADSPSDHRVSSPERGRSPLR